MRTLLGLTMAILMGAATAQSSGCGDATHTIPEIQGSDRRSPVSGEVVTVIGVVSAAYPGEDSLGGLFLQDLTGDGDAATSDGLFVRLTERSPFAEVVVTVGDQLRVSGKVLERNEFTQLDRLESLEVCGYLGLVSATPVVLPVASPDAWEAYEGMMVTFTEPLTVTEVFNVGRYGEVLLANRRLFIPTNGQPATDNALSRILMNDASRIENPERVPYLAPDLTLRVGDTVAGLDAMVMQFGLGAYRLEPARPPAILRSNPRQPRPGEVGGRLTAASFNVQNYFTSLNERGADTAEELARQTEKLVSALIALDADLVGLIEVENNTEAAQALADAVNAALGEEAYAVMPDPGNGTGTDQIKQAILYRPGMLDFLGAVSDPAEIHDRSPIAGTFRERASGEVFSVVVVHFKSKGSCPSAGDIDLGNGCWDLRRSAQSQAVIDLTSSIAAATTDPDVLVLGDLNSYGLEPPVALFTGQGFHNLDEDLPAEERYTYIFFGESGTLDYALASESLSSQVTGATIWHINSDEPPVIGYDLTFNPTYVFRPHPFRSSDHDPVVVGLELGE